MESYCAAQIQADGDVDIATVYDFLRKQTLVGLLPVPHPIIIRTYLPNAYTSIWFTSYIWGTVFVQRNLNAGGRSVGGGSRSMHASLRRAASSAVKQPRARLNAPGSSIIGPDASRDATYDRASARTARTCALR